jgi:hypothetical protein
VKTSEVGGGEARERRERGRGRERISCPKVYLVFFVTYIGRLAPYEPLAGLAAAFFSGRGAGRAEVVELLGPPESVR